jgi:uncharacterized protein with FMN-binding domain
VRKATGGAVGLASAVAIGTSWVAGLHPQTAALAGVQVVGTAPSSSAVPAGPPVPSETRSIPHLPAATRKPSAAAPPATPAAPAKPASGSVTGALVQTPYGDVQVRVAFTGRHITDVRALRLTDSSGTSVSISAQAEPILRQEALAAQSAQIDMVSGATYTSEGYVQSLQSAIDAAHLA